MVTNGFRRYATSHNAPPYRDDPRCWVARDAANTLVGALTALSIWDWLYIDELWVQEDQRGTGLGTELLQRAEQQALKEGLVGVWLWTQSWEAEGFYCRLGYSVFTRFEDFPRGHSRIGLRKTLTYQVGKEP